MKQLIALTTKLLSCPVAVNSFILLISLFALSAALFSEVALGLEPCIMCIYQRIPFVAGIILGSVGLALRNNKALSTNMIALSGLGFLINSAIALYHSGVELKWWRSAVEGCAVPNLGNEPQSILENILSAPTARCDEIAWSDPVFGLSMANYNVMLCFGLFVICAASVLLIKQHQSGTK